MEHTADEIKRLQGCINDLISILALPALWSGRDSAQMARMLLDGVVGMLRLDFAYARLSTATTVAPVELIRLAERRDSTIQPHEVGRALHRFLQDGPLVLPSPVTVPNPVGEGEVSIASFRMGLQDGLGILVAASARADFPTRIETLLLRVAANQAALGLREAQLLAEQKRAAVQMEQRVVERTHQLTDANTELRREIVERERSEQRLSVQYAITRILSESDTLATVTPHLLRAIGERMRWEWGALWVVEREAGVLHCQNIWHAPGLEAEEFDRICRETVFRRGEALPGYVWETASPIWFDDAAKNPRYVRAPVAARAGLRSTIAFPILLGGQTLGVIEFFSRTIERPNPEQLETLSAIGSQIGQFIERKEAQGLVKKADESIEMILDSITDSFFGIDKDWRYTHFNEHAKAQLKVLGKNPASLIGRVLWDEFPNPSSEEQLRRAMTERVVVNHEHYYPPLKEWVENRIYPSPDGGLAVFQRYVTERKEAEEQLLALKDELAAELIAMTRLHEFNTRLMATTELQPLLEEALDATIALQNADSGCIQLCNPETHALEIVAHRNVPQEFLDYFSSVEEDSAACGRAMQRGERIIIEDVETDEGFEPHRQIAAFTGFRAVQSTPLFSRNGETLGMLSTHFRAPHRPSDRDLRFTDLYARQAAEMIERKRVEEALHETQAELAHITRVTTLGELTASIAHEVNQPLGAIVTNGHACLRLLSRDKPDTEGAREAAEAMISDAIRASEVIKRIRSLLKKTVPEKAPLNINETVQEVIALASNELVKNQVSVRTELEDSLPVVMGDRVQLQQVVLNLILNSNEAMSGANWQPRELMVRSEASRPDRVTVMVRDTGTGFELNDRERVFDAFYTTKNHEGGLGLGLSISRTIIEAHGGRLWATQNEGPGATFQFTLPTSAER